MPKKTYDDAKGKRAVKKPCDYGEPTPLFRRLGTLAPGKRGLTNEEIDAGYRVIKKG